MGKKKYKCEGIIPAEGGRNMCKLKSAIILKDRIFMPDYDSHSKMLEELGITDALLERYKEIYGEDLCTPKERGGEK